MRSGFGRAFLVSLKAQNAMAAQASYKASLLADSGAPFCLVATPSAVPAAFGDVGRDPPSLVAGCGFIFRSHPTGKDLQQFRPLAVFGGSIDPRFDYLSAVRRLNELTDDGGGIAPLRETKPRSIAAFNRNLPRCHESHACET
jgi:hypothetical protein